MHCSNPGYLFSWMLSHVREPFRATPADWTCFWNFVLNLLGSDVIRDIMCVIWRPPIVCRKKNLQRYISTQEREMGLEEERVTQKSNKPSRSLTRHFSAGMLKKDHHIDQWESSASVLSKSYEEKSPQWQVWFYQGDVELTRALLPTSSQLPILHHWHLPLAIWMSKV